MSNTEKERRTLALLLGVAVLVLTLFSTVLHSEISQYDEDLQALERHAQDSVEQYLSLAIRINGGFLDTLESDWRTFERRDDSTFERFQTHIIQGMLASAYFSIIVTGDGQRFYNQDVYADLHINLECIPLDRTMTILFGDPQIPFGMAERLYIEGTILHGLDGREYYLYVGFLEPLMYSNFINALDLNTVSKVRNSLGRTMWIVLALLLGTITFGFTLLYHAMKLQVIVYRDIVKEMGGEPGGRRIYDPPADGDSNHES